MSDSIQGIIILISISQYLNISISLFCSVTFHWHLKEFKTAVLASAFVTAILFQLVAYLHLGYMDPFFLIALVTSFVLALIIACFVGLLFYLIKRKGKVT